MPLYVYRAIDRESNVHIGRMRADGHDALDRALGLQGQVMIDARELFSLPLPRSWHRGGVPDKELFELTYQLLLISSSGIPLLDGLRDVLSGLEKKSRLRPAFMSLADGVESGMSLSDVMFERSDLFPNYYAQMIRAGEVAGTLESSIRYLMAYLEWQLDFKKSIQSLLRYPLSILTLMTALGVLLFTFVFPSLGKVLSGLGIKLPLPTLVIMTTANIMHDYAIVIFPGLLLLLAGGKLFINTIYGRELADRGVLEIPLVGQLIRKINLSRYFKTLATMLASGLDIQTTFSTASEVVANTVLKNKLSNVTRSITAGESVSAALVQTGLLQPLVISVISLGEKTGNLDNALSRASDVFDKEVPETIKKVFAVIEPLIVVILGMLLLVVMLSIFLPIYSVIGNIRVR